MKKLISMTDFVLERNQRMQNGLVRRINSEYNKIIHYANFLKQPLTLGMFVPCDLDGNFLEESINYDAYKMGISEKDFHYNFVDCLEYQEAKDMVLFEGFHSFMNNVSNGTFEISLETYWFSDIQENGICFGQAKTLEDLIPFSLILTESAKKKIGL